MNHPSDRIRFSLDESEAENALNSDRPLIYIDDQLFAIDRFGLVVPGRPWPVRERPNADQIAAAECWLTGRSRPIATPKISSYELKHIAEKSAGTYIANGAMIVALSNLRYTIAFPQNSRPSVNVHAGVAMSSPDGEAGRCVKIESRRELRYGR